MKSMQHRQLTVERLNAVYSVCLLVFEARTAAYTRSEELQCD
jgi:hypothetical protein